MMTEQERQDVWNHMVGVAIESVIEERGDRVEIVTVRDRDVDFDVAAREGFTFRNDSVFLVVGVDGSSQPHAYIWTFYRAADAQALVFVAPVAAHGGPFVEHERSD